MTNATRPSPQLGSSLSIIVHHRHHHLHRHHRHHPHLHHHHHPLRFFPPSSFSPLSIRRHHFPQLVSLRPPCRFGTPSPTPSLPPFPPTDLIPASSVRALPLSLPLSPSLSLSLLFPSLSPTRRCRC
ncbi:hypothetical protein IE53DRAFT_176805 [Violaceomyces palustris]|uniref:Uncharacterized protein n=1 Tax=Violaceomyces palustris TaxID=1673888 RepID=A0ACD0NSM4_9BASI|nr:hypothetical protein IE53DRAFT_176805 [Violaceomyces palustris]